MVASLRPALTSTTPICVLVLTVAVETGSVTLTRRWPPRRGWAATASSPGGPTWAVEPTRSPEAEQGGERRPEAGGELGLARLRLVAATAAGDRNSTTLVPVSMCVDPEGPAKAGDEASAVGVAPGVAERRSVVGRAHPMHCS